MYFTYNELFLQDLLSYGIFQDNLRIGMTQKWQLVLENRRLFVKAWVEIPKSGSNLLGLKFTANFHMDKI